MKNEITDGSLSSMGHSMSNSMSNSISHEEGSDSGENLQKRRPYVAPAIDGEEHFERYALQACGGKDGSCGPFLAS